MWAWMAASPPIFIGNQTAFFASPLQPFDFAVERGFDAFEFFPDSRSAGSGWTTANLSQAARARIRATAKERGMRLSVHASIPSDPLTAKGSERFGLEMDFASEIGARILNLHFPSTDVDAFGVCVRALVPGLVAADLVLSLENTPPIAPEEFNAFFARLQLDDQVATRSIGMCLDIGHANLHPSTHNDYLAYLDRLSAQVPIVHVHAHENRGDADSHLTLFTGPIREDPAGLERLVRRLLGRGYSGSVILEQWPDPPDLLSTARDRLRAIIQTVSTTR
jgi:sugar phosphate isomerase/epimerase